MVTTLDLSPTHIYEPDIYTNNSRFWRGFKVVLIFMWETTLRVSLFVILGIAAHFFCPALTPPLLAMAIAAFTTRTIVKILDAYNFNLLINLQENVANFFKRYSKLQLIAFIFSLAISFLIPLVGVISGSALGVANGIIMGIELSKQAQKRQQNSGNYPKPIRDTVISLV